MKKLTARILESGLIDKHIAMAMEKWGTLERGASDLVGKNQVTRDTFQAFAHDIENLLSEPESPLHETVLDFELKGKGVSCTVPGLASFIGYWDEMLRLVVGPKVRVELGDLVRISDSESTVWQVVDINPIYINERIAAKKLTTIVPEGT